MLNMQKSLVSKKALIAMRYRIGRAQIPVACCATAPYRDSLCGASWDWSDSRSRSIRPWPQIVVSPSRWYPSLHRTSPSHWGLRLAHSFRSWRNNLIKTNRASVKWLPAVQWLGEGKRQKVLGDGESGVTPLRPAPHFALPPPSGRDLGWHYITFPGLTIGALE